ncbi:hypothetical protein [Azorhizobium doebereinerae]|uniref:hypothetical protein n=1 Tax=Azorhizobium doebereinerae TaxID=281091 RepID=UPI00041049F1|nr:hypothetical protein [Azorhizobium doebereinerae]
MQRLESDEGDVSGWPPQVEARFKLVISRLGGLKKCGDLVGVTAEQVGRWRDGKSKAPFVAVAKLVASAGLTLDWLTTGEEKPDVRQVDDGVHVDDELMGRVTDAIVRLYKDEKVALSPVDLGRLSARKYSEIASATDDALERLAMIKLVVRQLRADLRSAADEPGTGKRSA